MPKTALHVVAFCWTEYFWTVGAACFYILYLCVFDDIAGSWLTYLLQVQQIQEAAATLIVAYSGEKAREIQNHEMEVVNAWRNLQLRVEGRRTQLSNSTDLYRFFSMARDLLNWMTDLARQMESHEKPR